MRRAFIATASAIGAAAVPAAAARTPPSLSDGLIAEVAFAIEASLTASQVSDLGPDELRSAAINALMTAERHRARIV